MKFVCASCNTRYSIADDKVRQKILRIRCKTCGNVLTVRDDALAAPASGGSAGRVVAPAARGGSAGRAPAPASSGSVGRAPAPGTGSRPKPPPPPGPREAAEWFLAIEGAQTGPHGVTELAKKCVAALQANADTEIYTWKDGFEGWKPPADVPEIARRMNELRGAGRPAPPPPPPPVASRARAAAQAPAPSAPSAAAPRAPLAAAGSAPVPASFTGSGSGEFGGEAEATQIQPASQSLFTDLAPDLGDASLRPTPVTPVVSPFASRSVAESTAPVNGASKGTNGSSMLPAFSPGAGASPAASVDLLGGALSTPFFPPPVAAGLRPGSVAGIQTLTGGPPPAESGLSKLIGIGGIFVRKPSLRYFAAGVAILLVVGAVVLAVVSSSKELPANQTALAGSASTSGSAADPDRAARDQAARWFAPGADKPSRATIEPVRPGPRPVKRPPARPAEKAEPAIAPPPPEPTAPPPVAPPPIGQAAARPTTERAVQAFAPPAARRAAPPSAGAGASGTAGGSEPTAEQMGQIRTLVSSKASQDSVKSCYARALRQSGANTGGRLEVMVSVRQNGRVRTVGVTSSDGLKSIHECIKGAVTRWHFPAGPEDYGMQFTLLMQSS